MTDKNCPMCGKPSNHLIARWYQYDNDEQFIAWVCKKCVDTHDKVVVKK
jgi:hypothetical protein